MSVKNILDGLSDSAGAPDADARDEEEEDDEDDDENEEEEEDG
jgi:ribosomal protein L12E/L44/L45/RPP1/RPP2